MRKLGSLAIFLMLAGAAFAADQRPPQAHQRETPPKTAAPARKAAPVLTDAQLEADIRARFAKSKINADHFTVRVQGGAAYIEGRTDVLQHKGVATRMARSAGAIAVNNHIQISDAAREKAVGNLEKGRRRAQVQRGESRSQATPARSK